MSIAIPLKTPFGKLHALLGSQGIRAIGWTNRPDAMGAKPEPWDQSTQAQTLCGRLKDEIAAYAAGTQQSFSLPLDLKGHTTWRLQVWRVMQTIPYGKTMSYGQIAKQLGKPGAARAVGQACGANPIPVLIPCHRVLAGNGIGGFSSGLTNKRKLLALEGIKIP